jgi:hypothetical protein
MYVRLRVKCLFFNPIIARTRKRLHILVKIPHVKFHENSSNCFVRTDAQVVKHDEVAALRTPTYYKISVLRSWRWALVCPKHVELILEINKLLLLHLVGFLYYFTYIVDARSNTNQPYSLFALPIRVKRRCQFQDWINLAQTKIHYGALKHGNYVSSLTRNKFFFTSRTTESDQTTGSCKHLLLRVDWC